MKAKFIKVDGISTRYLAAGPDDGYPLLLLHGYGGTADVWIRNIDALGESFRVIAVDMLGFGFTDAVEIAGTAPQAPTVEHLVKFIDTLKLDKLGIIGTSYGSSIAALLHLRLPHRVEKLVLTGSASCFNPPDMLAQTWNGLLANHSAGMEEPSLALIEQVTRRQVYDSATIPPEILPIMVTAYAREGTYRFWRDGLHALLHPDSDARYGIRDRLDLFKIDVLVIWGENDPGALLSAAKAGVEKMRSAKLISFEKCGHKPMFEAAERYNRSIMEFFSTEKGRKVGEAPAEKMFVHPG